ncbi:hypothetical protein CISIN_1g0360741mg, partial [Citrus sinensis]
MEMNFIPYHHHLVNSLSNHHHPKNNHLREEEGDDASLSLRNLSKLILPPLGVSSYNQNQTKSKWIISPMDSRY